MSAAIADLVGAHITGRQAAGRFLDSMPGETSHIPTPLSPGLVGFSTGRYSALGTRSGMNGGTAGLTDPMLEGHCRPDRDRSRAKWLADYDRALAPSLTPPAAPVRALLKAAAMRSNGAGLLSDAATERLVRFARLGSV